MSAPDRTEIAAAVSAAWGVEGTVERLDGENDNYVVAPADGSRLVLKLAEPDADDGRIRLEHAAVEAVHASSIAVEVPRLVPDKDGDVAATLAVDGATRPARLLRFVAGDPWTGTTSPSPALLRGLGTLVADLAGVLAPLDLPAAHVTHRWDLARADAHRPDARLIEDDARRRLVLLQLERWCAAAQDLATVPHGLIHGDLNDENVLVEGDRIVGLLDFGDMLHNPLVCDLAIALAYALLEEPDPWRAGAEVVAGYHGRRPLSPVEIELLYPLICARLAVSVIVAARRRRIDPERDAWFVSEERAWGFLERRGDEDPVAVADRLAASTDVAPYDDRGAPFEELLERRRAITSSAQSITYREPVKFIRGRRAWLIDERGRPFLDLYNNVCHVGHCHPGVVRAGQEQMARLNTNTRYLTDEHVAYAERLAATLPEELDTVFLVNSGSEANELALRLASAHTGRDDVYIVENAYHGHTRRLIDVSPYKFLGPGGKGRPEDGVHVVPVPDGFRGRHRGDSEETGIAYGDDVGAMITGAARPPAVFMAETLLSCGGQIIPPPGYFETVFEHVRAAGGVCILDEVQVGFGRVGSHFWAFESYDVVPDIVVMGKPIGNGHPLGAVVCTGEISRSFADAGMEFFSTFGGNPVSCAIGNAVLDVIADEGLQDNARATGAYFLEALGELQPRFPCIGNVRGIGLFVGIDLVEDDGVTPATQLAADTIEELRRHRILTGTDGPHDNVIKIKPPLVVTPPDVDRFVLDLGRILGQLVCAA